MKYVYGTLITLLVGLVVIFSVQNVAHVTISFLTMSATMPLVVLVLLVFVGGVVTGAAAMALREWMGLRSGSSTRSNPPG